MSDRLTDEQVEEMGRDALENAEWSIQAPRRWRS